MSESLINKFKNDKMTLLATIDCKKEYSKIIKKKLEDTKYSTYVNAKIDGAENFTQSKIMMNVVGGGSIIDIYIYRLA